MPRPQTMLPMVIIPKPCCPRCRSHDVESLRSNKNEDGSSVRYTACKRCNQRFHVVVDPDTPPEIA